MKIDLGHDGVHQLSVEKKPIGCFLEVWAFCRDGEAMRYVQEDTLEYLLIQQFLAKKWIEDNLSK